MHHGIPLEDAEQRRRHLILSLLADGLDAEVYRQKFREAAADFPELQQLVNAGLATASTEGWSLTSTGVERSDAIGPWLQSAKVTSMMKEYEVR